MNLKGKKALIAGAGGGLGNALVKELDNLGVDCVLLSRNEDKLKELSKSLKYTNGKYYAVDFSDSKQTTDALDMVVKDVGSLDLLINAMGIGIYKGIEEVTLDEWNNSLSINLTAPFLLTKYMMGPLKKSESPMVINIGSGLGKEIYHNKRVAYIASKFGLRGLSLALSKDYQDERIRFSYIALGSMLTSFGPGGIEERLKKQAEGKKYFTPEWVARKLIEFINEDKLSDEITLFPGDYL